MKGDTIVVQIEKEPEYATVIQAERNNDGKKYSSELWKTVVVLSSGIDNKFIHTIGKPGFIAVSNFINGSTMYCRIVLTEKWDSSNKELPNMSALHKSVLRSNNFVNSADWVLF